MQKPSWPVAAADEGFRAEILESPYTHTETCLVEVSRIVGPLPPRAATDPFRTPVVPPGAHPANARARLTARSGCGGLGYFTGYGNSATGVFRAHRTSRGSAQAPGPWPAPLDQGRCRGTHLLAEPQESNGVSLSPEAARAVHTAGPGRDKWRSAESWLNPDSQDSGKVEPGKADLPHVHTSPGRADGAGKRAQVPGSLTQGAEHTGRVCMCGEGLREQGGPSPGWGGNKPTQGLKGKTARGKTRQTGRGRKRKKQEPVRPSPGSP